MNEQNIKAALEWRYAVKKFDSTKKMTDAQWALLEESLKLSPSSYGLQPWKFFVVQNPEIREKLKAVSWNQTQVTDCSHYVVMAYMPKLDAGFVQKYIDRIVEVRGVTAESLEGYKQMMIQSMTTHTAPEPWAQRQVYIAMGFLLETAALMQVDACPMEGIDPLAYDKILGLEGTPYKTLATVALGFRHPEDGLAKAKKVRFKTEELISWVK